MSSIAFHRPARALPEPVSTEGVRIVAPPELTTDNGGPFIQWLTVLIPMLGMGGGFAFFFVGFGGSSTGGNNKIVIAIVLMITLMILSIVLSQVLKRYLEKKKLRRNAAKYRAYLLRQTDQLERMAHVQRRALAMAHPAPDAIWEMVLERTRVWERRRSDQDFLDLRLGLGDVPLASPALLQMPENPLAEHDPVLLYEAEQLAQGYQMLAEAPASIRLRSYSSVNVVGERRRTRALTRSLLLQLAAFHSPDDVQLILCVPPQTRGDWEWAKWLPHARGIGADGQAASAIAGDATVFGQLLEDLVRPRLDRVKETRYDTQARPADHPHLVVVVDGYSPRSAVGRIGLLSELMDVGRAADVTVITICEFGVESPSWVDARLTLDDARLEMEETGEDARRTGHCVPDSVDIAECERIARGLAPLRLGERRTTRQLSGTVQLLDLLGAPRADGVQPRQTWRARPLGDTLRSPLGVRVDGEPLVIDLKEAASGGMGPHGLIVGATGSGKSELLRTLVTGLAHNHSPDVLSFVFADFKGGAAFADLSTLPHVAGLITNLQSDLSRVDRMRAALVGEQERRQRMLRDAGNLDNIGDYQARNLLDPDMEPMPYLLIVVDEFSELLTARPDFLELFVAIGRVGRSLGMHLLLATQRLDEGRISGLEGHLRYRICLRTFSESDSQAALGTRDAFHLPSFPGLGYFKVDNTYVQFKTALITSPFVAEEMVSEAASACPPVPTFTGVRTADTGERGPRDADSADLDGQTQMEVVIGRLRTGPSRPVHQVWLPVLEPDVTLDRVGVHAGSVGGLRVPLGIVDLPNEQRQAPMIIDFSGTNGHLVVVGTPQSGKSMLLRTLLTSFALTHSPDEAQFYCIDLGGGSLHAYEHLPNVGAVCGKLEPEKVQRVVREMRNIVAQRERLFRTHNIDSMATLRRRQRSGELLEARLGDAFLVIDNWAQLRKDFEDLEPEVVELLTGGLAYGVHVVLASTRWGDFRMNVKDAIGTRLEFHVNDPIDSEFGRDAAKRLPNKPGRGLGPGGHEFQVALPRVDGQGRVEDLGEVTEALVARLQGAWREHLPAPPVRMLPAVLTPEALPGPGAGPPGVPLGVEEFELAPVCFDPAASDPHLLVLGDSESGKTNLLRALLRGLEERYTEAQMQVVVIDYRRTLIDMAGSPLVLRYAPNPTMATQVLTEVRALLETRMPGADVSWEHLVDRNWWTGPEICVIVDDYDLVPGPMGSPMTPLQDMLAQGRDVGLHVVLARRVAGVSRSAFEPFYQRIREVGTPGILLSGDPSEGPVLGAQRAQQQPPGRGHLVRRNQRTALVQTVLVPISVPKGSVAAP